MRWHSFIFGGVLLLYCSWVNPTQKSIPHVFSVGLGCLGPCRISTPFITRFFYSLLNGVLVSQVACHPSFVLCHAWPQKQTKQHRIQTETIKPLWFWQACHNVGLSQCWTVKETSPPICFGNVKFKTSCWFKSPSHLVVMDLWLCWVPNSEAQIGFANLFVETPKAPKTARHVFKWVYPTQPMSDLQDFKGRITGFSWVGIYWI